MASINMCIRTDSELKSQAEEVLSQLGMSMGGTINMFLSQIVREQAVPLNLSLTNMPKKKNVLTYEEISFFVRRLLKKYKADKAMLFGSYARGEANELSDIDLLIYGGDDFDLTDIFSISEELNRFLNKETDVYEISEIKKDSEFYRTILSEGVMIS